MNRKSFITTARVGIGRTATTTAALLAALTTSMAAASADTISLDGPIKADRVQREVGREIESARTTKLDRPSRERPVVSPRPPAAPTEVLCPADFDASGIVSYNDLFMFLDLYFAGDKKADMNLDGFLGAGDIFDYIAHFVDAC